MQPDAPQKPVMDVTPPRPASNGPAALPVQVPMPDAAPGQALAVHEPPRIADDPSAAPVPPQPAEAKAPAPRPESKPKPVEPAKRATPHAQRPPLPAGAITMALLTMAVLAAITVVAYIKS